MVLLICLAALLPNTSATQASKSGCSTGRRAHSSLAKKRRDEARLIAFLARRQHYKTGILLGLSTLVPPPGIGTWQPRNVVQLSLFFSPRGEDTCCTRSVEGTAPSDTQDILTTELQDGEADDGTDLDRKSVTDDSDDDDVHSITNDTRAEQVFLGLAAAFAASTGDIGRLTRSMDDACREGVGQARKLFPLIPINKRDAPRYFGTKPSAEAMLKFANC